jgi:hypothetical protein
MPFGWKAFRTKCRIVAQDEGWSASLMGQVVGRLGLWLVNQAAWAGDEIVARGWRSATMTGPIFIIGHQRSGTTLLHRLLALDHAHARALQFQEMIFPAISIQNAVHAVRRWDGLHGNRLKIWLDRRQAELLGPMDHIHRIRLDEIEEDEFVLWAIFMSAMCANDAPSSVARHELDELRTFSSWTPDRQQLALGWYRACLFKKITREPSPKGEPLWIVAKNPAFSQKIPQLLKVFPDARFVHLVRNPLETIPSRLSLIREIWRTRLRPDIEMTPQQVEVILRDSIQTYAAAHRDLSTVSEHRRITVSHSEFREDPARTVKRIYAQLQLPECGDFLNLALAARNDKPLAQSIRHEYKLEEFGLTPDRIRAELPEIFDAYRFN